MSCDVFTIENEALRVTVSARGAEMISIYDKTAEEELLKAPGGEYWGGTAPILFPICGRLYKGETHVGGKPYRMGAHGFAQDAIFSVKEQGSDCISLCFSGNREILERQYPFRFSLTVTYALCGKRLETRATVENRGEKEMPFAIGFHPGFRMKINGETRLEDHSLEFDPPCRPDVWVLSPRAYLTDETIPFPLENDRIFRLNNEYFRIDGVFFENVSPSVTLRSRRSSRALRLDYEGFRYLGVWRPYAPEADFVCLEPWLGSPDYDDRGSELREKRDMTILAPAESREISFFATFLD